MGMGWDAFWKKWQISPISCLQNWLHTVMNPCFHVSTAACLKQDTTIHHPQCGKALTCSCNQGYITHKSWRPLITLMYALEWLLCARYGFQGLEMQPMRFVSCVVHLEKFWGLLHIVAEVTRDAVANTRSKRFTSKFMANWWQIQVFG